ncbi:hypothetical protein AGMMS49975_09740 [Clostridia bacterium]|nr:hypothetical protein AGMMS49975_09740 [Clostridia bacterium]
MAFVNEELNEQDKAFIASFNFLRPIGTKKPVDIPETWVSDRGNEIFLICLGGQGHRFDKEFPPTFWRLIWKGLPIEIETFDKGIGDWTIGKKIFWNISRITAPLALNVVDGKLLLKTIKDAFETYERARNKNIISIEFVEITAPNFRKDI